MTPTVQWSLTLVVSPHPGGPLLATQTDRDHEPLPRAMMTTVISPTRPSARHTVKPGGPQTLVAMVWQQLDGANELVMSDPKIIKH